MILVVEDDPLQLSLLREILGGREHAVATSATEARVLLAGREEWKGIILDLGLPEGLDAGLELLRALRGDDKHRALPCVVTTGQWDGALAWEIPNVLRAEYVLKPVTFVGLARFLEGTDRRGFQHRAAVVARARERYDLSERQSEILAWFIEGRSIRAFLLHANIGSSSKVGPAQAA